MQLRNTKIIATLGPSSSDEEIIHKLILAGANSFRLNFSHGAYATHKKNLETVRALSDELNTPIAVLLDLPGTKIRLGMLKDEPIQLTKGEQICLSLGDEQKDATFPVQVNIFPYLKANDPILINDGVIELRVISCDGKKAECEVIIGGKLTSRKGVNIPKTQIPDRGLTDRDKEDIAFGLKNKVDYICMSFTQSKKILLEIRDIVSKQKHRPWIIAKIERKDAVANLEEILQEADGVMIGRGDLGVEVGQEEVPIIQRKVISLAKKLGKPVIVATQMLESMIEQPTPTRAEVNDIATAVLDSVDAVMLSAESASGKYPVEAVSVMTKVINRVESHIKDNQTAYEVSNIIGNKDQSSAIAAATAVLAYELKAKSIISLTETGRTAKRIASYRPFVPSLAVTDDETVFHQLALIYGTQPFFIERIKNNEAAYETATKILKNMKILEKDDKVVMVTGNKPGESGNTNTIKVSTI